MIESGHIEICLTILTGKNCVLLNSVKEWLFLMSVPFWYICLRSQLRSINSIRSDTYMTSTLGGGGGSGKNEMLLDVGSWEVGSVLDVQSLFFLLIKLVWAMTRHHVESSINKLLTRNLPMDFNNTTALFVG